MFVETSSVNFVHKVTGTWGTFSTPAGSVSYVMTKARLGTTGIDAERRLTSQLRPVREVLDPKGLDFNQLLQRDLDDHRVATQLLPYILRPKANGPGFFPPIVAVLLPFNGKHPVDHFPAANPIHVVKDEGAMFAETRFGSAFAVRKLSNDEGKPHSTIRLGQCLWNDEQAKLVVLDGQHRAMALIAVDRTINQTWDQGAGAKYRHFYEARVRELLDGRGGEIELDQVEIPVVLCWFPSLPKESSAHKAARKLFVDVNKEARQPSEARLTLLSDTELLNIFTRSMLNRLRQPKPPLPLFSIEYDNPDVEAARPVRWSVITNLTLLKFAARLTVFGPSKYVKNLDSRFGGRLNWSEMNERMRTELDVKSLFPETIDDEHCADRARLGNDHFPLNGTDKLTERFMEGWGSAILHVIGNLEPYAAHARALSSLESEWTTDDAMSSLAKDAMFVGVGMYWTLRDSEAHWKEHVRKLQDEQKPVPPKPEIVKAWEILDKKSNEFSLKRSFEYAGKTDAESIKETDTLFEATINTHACQLGILLTVATIAQRMGISGKGIVPLAERLVAAWNAALKASVSKSRDRRFVFTREGIKAPINRIRKLDTPFAVYFRYFWLELLATKEGRAELDGVVAMDVLAPLVRGARANYFRYLVEEQFKDLRSSNPDARGKDKKLREKAVDIEAKELRRALKNWFDVPEPEFDEWLASLSKSATPEQTEETEANGSDPGGGPGADEGLAVPKQVEDVEDLIRDADED